ncbi:MAG: hypothetical protein P8Z30_16535 [Acidobacteriota bacterium]
MISADSHSAGKTAAVRRQTAAAAGRPAVRFALGSLLAFGALNAFAGGYYGLAGARGVPTEWLAGSPFRDYWIPSLILFIIVGGSFLVAAVAVFAGLRSLSADLFWWRPLRCSRDYASHGTPLSGLARPFSSGWLSRPSSSAMCRGCSRRRPSAGYLCSCWRGCCRNPVDRPHSGRQRRLRDGEIRRQLFEDPQAIKSRYHPGLSVIPALKIVVISTPC